MPTRGPREHEHERAQAPPAPAKPVVTHVAPARSPALARVIALQRGIGNAAVTAMLDRRPQDAAASPTDEEVRGSAHAQAIHTAISFTGDGALALATLQALSPSERLAMSAAFVARYGRSVDVYLCEELTGDQRVDALSLVDLGHGFGQHAAMARVLIGDAPRPSDPLRLLKKTSLGGREELEWRYDRVFGRPRGASLRADLADVLDAPELQRAELLLEGEVTPAQELYLDSVAISGATNTDAVVKRIRDTYATGSAALAALDADWQVNVVGKGLDDDSLRDAMTGELSGEAEQLVLACFDGMAITSDALLGELAGDALGALGASLGFGGGAHQRDPDAFTPEEQGQLAAAEATVQAATVGGWTGVGTNRSALLDGAATIRRTHEQRLARARKAGSEPLVITRLELELRWAMAKLAVIGHSETSGVDLATMKLTLAGDLTAADKLWLATEEGEDAKAVEVATAAWKAHRIDTLLSDLEHARFGGAGEVLRPGIIGELSLGLLSGTAEAQLRALMRPGVADGLRGAELLGLLLGAADGDAELQAVVDLLDGVDDATRGDMISRCLGVLGIAPDRDEKPEQRFRRWLEERFEHSTAVWRLADLVDPVSAIKDPGARAQESLRRAEGRHAALHSAWGESTGKEGYSAKDFWTGEDHGRTEGESLERLRWMTTQVGLEGADLGAMLAMADTEDVGELADMEYGLFVERADAVKKAKQEAVEFASTVLTVLVGAVLTACTGGTYLAVVASALAASAAGMTAREAGLGADYELWDGDNAIELAAVAAAAASSQFGGNLYKGWAGGEAAVAALGRRGDFMEGAFKQAFEALGDTPARVLLEQRLPNDAEVMAKLQALGLGVASSGVGKLAGGRVDPALAATHLTVVRAKLVDSAAASLTNSLATASIQASGEEGFGTGTGYDWLARVSHAGVMSLGKSLSDTCGEIAKSALAKPEAPGG